MERRTIHSGLSVGRESLDELSAGDLPQPDFRTIFAKADSPVGRLLVLTPIAPGCRGLAD